MALPSHIIRPYIGQIIAWISTLTFLIIISRVNYLLFHTLVEIFSILVAGGIFAFTWNTRKISYNTCLIFLGIAYLGVAALDLFHFLTFPGIFIIKTASTNTSAQLWVSARFLEALSLFLAPFFLTRSLDARLAIGLVLGFAALVLSTVLIWPVFPRCYLPGQGLTFFKIGMEWAICGLLFIALIYFFLRRKLLDRQVFLLLISSIGITVLSEIFFTLYILPTGIPNLLGHLFKVLSFYLIYQAIIVTGVIRPYTYLNMAINEKEQALVLSEERYRRIIEDQKEIICRFNKNGQLTFTNHPFCQFFGQNPSDLTNYSFKSLLSPEVQSNFNSILKKINADEPVQEYTHPILSHKGQQAWLHWTIQGIVNDQAKIIEYQAVARDVTELQSTLSELNYLKEYYRILTEEAPVSIMSFDKSGRITFVNKWHIKVFANNQMDESFFLGRHLTELPGIVAAGIGQQLASLLQGHSLSLDKIYFPEVFGGGSRYVNIRGVPLFIQGEFIGGILLREDITDQQTMVSELQKARQKAERANRTKDIFLANMSHEIRTPLNAILGLSSLCLDQGLSEKQKKRIEYIRTSAESLLGIIEDLLDLSKIEVGELRIQNNPFNLTEFADSIIGEMSLSAQEKGLGLELIQDPKLPEFVVGDALRLRQILRNLIVNALKFTEQGKVQLKLSLDSPKPSDQSSLNDLVKVIFQVIDTGPGIPKKEQDKIFEPFSYSENPDPTTYRSSGLGLTICKRLVKHLGGKIWLQSEPGQGSAFSVSLPFQVNQDEKIYQAESLPDTSSQQISTKKLRVLLVEDQPMNQIYIEDLLEGLDHEVYIAQNGQEALKRLEVEDFDLILMDIRMPVMDGLTATRKIREEKVLEKNSRIPIIGLSAHANPDDVKTYLQSGMDDYLIKPVSPEDLYKALQEVVFKTSDQERIQAG